jgi:hypothetical protein
MTPVERHYEIPQWNYQNKGSVPFGAEPFTSDSAMVALHAHKEANVPAQGFHSGFQPTPRSTSLASGYLSTLPLQLSS